MFFLLFLRFKLNWWTDESHLVCNSETISSAVVCMWKSTDVQQSYLTLLTVIEPARRSASAGWRERSTWNELLSFLPCCAAEWISEEFKHSEQTLYSPSAVSPVCLNISAAAITLMGPLSLGCHGHCECLRFRHHLWIDGSWPMRRKETLFK